MTPSPYKRLYDPEDSRQYQNRKPGKHRAEMRLIDRAFALIPKAHTVLDLPCGGGRVTLHLAKMGYPVSAADFSEGMMALTQAAVTKLHLTCPVEKQDVEALTYPDRAFDTVLCFRLFHHFPNPEVRRRAIAQLCRVSRYHVVLSYFSPLSWKAATKKLQTALGGKASHTHHTSLAEVEGYFSAANFRLVKDFAQQPLLHTLHLAVFSRHS